MACGGGGGDQGTPDAPAATHRVSGNLSPASLGAGATVTLGTRTATASATGGFSFTNVSDGTYTVTPSKSGVTFTPASRSITVSGADVVGVDFAAGASTRVRLSGAIHSALGQVVDSDTGDPNAPSVSNDTPALAQSVPSAVTVGGHASFIAADSVTDDDIDAFRGNFTAGEIVNLAIADAESGDLDLYLYTVADTENPVDTSLGTTERETLSIPDGGEYFVVVRAASGSSNYVLNAGAGPGSTRANTLRLESEIVPGEVVVQFDEAALGPAGGPGDVLAHRAAALGLIPLAGGVRGRPARLGLGDTTRARATALAGLGVARRPASPFGIGPDEAAWDTIRAIKALRARADVRTADPNYILRAQRTPDDSLYGFQWHYPLINLPQAWDVTIGAPASGSVVVAVIDTGVFLAHPDMTGQLVAGYDFIASSTQARDGDGIDANADDPGDAAAAGSSSWHGTHVAGTIAARTNDGSGAAGVSWAAKIMPVRVLGAGGGTSYDIIQGVRFAAGLSNDSGTVPPDPADIANLSLGCQNCFSQAAQDTFDAARAAGMIVVAAAGNASSSDPGFPASYDGVISVSAVDLGREQAGYSNRGPFVDIAAPGGDTGVDSDGNGYVDGVLSALVDDSGGTRAPMWKFYQGTSMAAPHVAGVLALMKAVCPSLSATQVDAFIAGGAITNELGAAGRDDIFGHGLIDALAGVRAAQSECGVTPATGLDVSPGRLDLGAAAASAVLTATKQGTGALAVTFVTDNVPWLTVTPAAVDASGLGTYTATVSRAGLAAGPYVGSITFSLQAGGSVVVPVSMRVGGASTAGDAGYLYVLLVDTSQTTLAQAQGRGVAGTYDFEFTNVPPGELLIVAGTDSDDDGLICDAGEACGAWPTLGAPSPLTVGGVDVGGLDFGAGFEVSLPSSAAFAPAPRRGYARLPDPKAVAPR